MFLAYVFESEEGATLFELPFAKYDVAPPDLMTDLVRKYAAHCIAGYRASPGEDEAATKAEITAQVAAAKTNEEIVDIIFDKCCVQFDKVAIVVDDDGSKEKVLAAIGNKLSDRFGDDSSTYAAVDTWGEVLVSHSIMTIDFPRGMWADEREEERLKLQQK